MRAIHQSVGKKLMHLKHRSEAPSLHPTIQLTLALLKFREQSMLVGMSILVEPSPRSALITPSFALIGAVLVLQTRIKYRSIFDPPSRRTLPLWLIIVRDVEFKLRRKKVTWTKLLTGVYEMSSSKARFDDDKASTARASSFLCLIPQSWLILSRIFSDTSFLEADKLGRKHVTQATTWLFL